MTRCPVGVEGAASDPRNSVHERAPTTINVVSVIRSFVKCLWWREGQGPERTGSSVVLTVRWPSALRWSKQRTGLQLVAQPESGCGAVRVGSGAPGPGC